MTVCASIVSVLAEAGFAESHGKWLGLNLESVDQARAVVAAGLEPAEVDVLMASARLTSGRTIEAAFITAREAKWLFKAAHVEDEDLDGLLPWPSTNPVAVVASGATVADIRRGLITARAQRDADTLTSTHRRLPTTASSMDAVAEQAYAKRREQK